MKAFAGLLAVLLVLGSMSLAQTAASQPAATPSAEPAPATSAEAPAASASAAPAAAGVLAPGAKVFLEPMNGFEQLLSDSIAQKKVPVVMVRNRAAADFVMSGEVHLKKRGFVTGMVLSTRGGANIAMKDAHTGSQVFGCNFHRVDSNERQGDIYLGWADQCAGRLKKVLKQK